MWIFIVILSFLVVWAAAASVVVALRDGYRPVPACAFEGERNRT
jgi:hypothetical protein